MILDAGFEMTELITKSLGFSASVSFFNLNRFVVIKGFYFVSSIVLKHEAPHRQQLTKLDVRVSRAPAKYH